MNAAALDRSAATPGSSELGLNGAMLLTYSGRPAEALAVLGPVGELAGQRARAIHAIADVPALIVTGRCETAVEAADRRSPSRASSPTRSPSPVRGCTSSTRLGAGRMRPSGRGVGAGHGGLRGDTSDGAA